MDSEKEKNFGINLDISSFVKRKTKSAEILIDKTKPHNNKNQKQEKSYRVGNYLIKKTLGSGTFGKVKLGIYIPTQEKVAVKILEKSKMTEKDDQIRLEREFQMLAQFNHPNLIMVTEIFESSNNYYTVMDYCEGGELFNYIVKNKYLSEKEASFFYYQIISGLEYIHSLGIVHRDLKPENLLLTKDHILKIIDFGLSNYFKEGQNDLLYTPCGSPSYASPEMVTGNNYDGVMIDIWSTGIILFAMLCGYLPFEDKNNEKLFKKIAQCKIEYPEYLSETAVDLLKKIIVPNPKKRITINGIKRHPFYLKGKKIFDQEFTIEFFNDDSFNNEKDEKLKEEKNIKNGKYKENNINDNNEDKCKKNDKNEMKKEEKMKIKDNKENKEIKENNNNKKETNNEIKEEIKYEKKENINSININNNDINKNPSPKNKNYNNTINKKENYNNNIKNNITNNKTNKNGPNININNNNDNIIKNNNINSNNPKAKQLDKDIKYNPKTPKENTKTINNNGIMDDNINTIVAQAQKDFPNKKQNLKKCEIKNDLFLENPEQKAIIKNLDKNIKSNSNNNEKSINILNLKKIEDFKNNTIEAVPTNYINIEENLGSDIQKKNNMKKINKLSDKYLLIIEDLNNSVDNNKIRNKNNIMNTHSNNNMNKTKELIKKDKDNNNNNYCSNAYNIKKTKKIIAGNKVMNTVLGKILKINIIEKTKDKRAKEKEKEKKNIKFKNIIKNKENNNNKINDKNNDDYFNQKKFSTRNTYCEGDSKILEKQKNNKIKKRKTEIINNREYKIFNPKTKYFFLNSDNFHKLTMSTDFNNNNNTQIDINPKKNMVKNLNNIDNIYIDDNNINTNKGNKSVIQEFYPKTMKKMVGVHKNYLENLKINSNSIKNKNKNISINNKSNNDNQDYNLKTETNEILHTDVGINNMQQKSKYNFKANKKLFKLDSKHLNKDANKQIKNSLYKKQISGIYSSNNLDLKYFKLYNNGAFLKNVFQNILNENRIGSNRKRNFKRKFNNLRNINNFHLSENKIKKYNKIFIQKTAENKQSNLSNITNSYSSKTNNNYKFKSNFMNYNNNINSKEKTYSKDKNLKNERILNFSNKYPVYYTEDAVSSIDYEVKNKNINMNTVQSIKSDTNSTQEKHVRQIKKNNNYIHIRKKQIKPENNRNNTISWSNNKTKKKIVSSEEPFNIKENTINNNINSMKNPFHQLNNAYLNKTNKNKTNRHKINLKKINIYKLNINSNNNKPLLNISNTFISFNMYPKYYIDPKKQLSSPKIATESSLKKKNSKVKFVSNQKIASMNNINYGYLRKNTSPGVESPSKKFEMNNFKNIQQNIFNIVDNQKLYYYTNTEYEQNIDFPKNINLDTLQNMENKIVSKKYNDIGTDLPSNKKINKLNINNNQNRNSNIYNNKNLSNTISPSNKKKFKNKVNFNNFMNIKYMQYNPNVINYLNDNNKKNKKGLTNFILNNDTNSNKRPKEYELNGPSHDFLFMKNNDLINSLEKIHLNIFSNKELNSKIGVNNKPNKNK